MRDVEGILEKEFSHGDWIVEKPTAGMAKEAYVATRGEVKVFIKFDADTPALERLAELRITPPLLRRGRHDGHPYTIQTYVEGVHPDWRWFTDHLSHLATLMRRYHTDAELARIICPGVHQSYEQHVERTVARLERELTQARTRLSKMGEMEESLRRLRRKAEQLEPIDLVPVHLDPSDKNFLVAGHRIYLLDWDDIRLSDPLRDAGLLLWWYVPTARWRDFFHAYGCPLDAHMLARLYWWGAASCLGIAFWFDRTGDVATVDDFIGDFNAALDGKDNPRAPFGRM